MSMLLAESGLSAAFTCLVVKDKAVVARIVRGQGRWRRDSPCWFGCDLPVQLAALSGGVGGPDLAAAVRDAGGLGMVTAYEEIPRVAE